MVKVLLLAVLLAILTYTVASVTVCISLYRLLQRPMFMSPSIIAADGIAVKMTTLTDTGEGDGEMSGKMLAMNMEAALMDGKTAEQLDLPKEDGLTTEKTSVDMEVRIGTRLEESGISRRTSQLHSIRRPWLRSSDCYHQYPR
jgi:hypothetical protein